MKKPVLHSLIGISALFAASAFAGSYSANCPKVSVPCKKTFWDVGIEFGYVRAVNPDLSFQEDVSLTPPNLPSQVRYVKPKFDWAFRFIASHHFSNGNDLTFNFMRYRDRQVDRADSTLSSFAGQVPSLTTAYGGLESKIETVNLEFGQMFKVSKRMDARLHVGTQYAHLYNQISSTNGGGDLITLSFSEGAPTAKRSDFKGFGARFGVDTDYDINDTFALVFHGAVSILMGNVKVRVNTGEPFDSSSNSDTHDKFQTFVPGTEARFAIKGTKPTSTGKFNAELGYQMQGFSGAVIHAQNGAYSFDDDRNHVSGLGLHGPYIQLKYVTNS